MSTMVELHPFEVNELADLVGLIEDWLLHTGDETLAELAEFCGPACRVGSIITELGHASTRLRRLTEDSRR